MWPIGPLMHEHRLIEKMIARIDNEAAALKKGSQLDPAFIDAAVDFIRTYADRCHHGKEEDILFRELEAREMSPELVRLMNELIEDHKYGRSVVAKLVKAKDRYLAGDSAAQAEAMECLIDLAGFYPKHIEKEDKHFFFPCMDLFDKAEKEAMLDEFYTFDRQLIHRRYQAVVDQWEVKKA